VTAAAAATGRVAEVMVMCPKTHSPDCGLDAIRAFFTDDHVHMALIVAPDGRLVTTIERPDLATVTSNSAPVTELGTLARRTARPADPVEAATAKLVREGRRRLAVIDESGRLIGLLCLKRDGTGYCSDQGIRERAQRGALHRSQHPEVASGLPHAAA
jgi:CBS-domain-containing membrane protein